MPASSSLRNSHSMVSRFSLTRYPRPCFCPSRNVPLNDIPLFARICLPFPLALLSSVSPSYWLFWSSLLMEKLSLQLMQELNTFSSASSYFLSRLDDLRLMGSFFYFPVSCMMASYRTVVSSSRKPNNMMQVFWFCLGSLGYLASFYFISMNLRLEKGITASVVQGLGGEKNWACKLIDFSPILRSLALISLMSLDSRMTFCSRGRLDRWNISPSSSKKKYRIQKDFLTRFSRNRIPILWFKQPLNHAVYQQNAYQTAGNRAQGGASHDESILQYIIVPLILLNMSF